MSEEAREQNRLYQKEWRAKNKEKVKQYNQCYWQKRADRVKKERENGGKNISDN